MMERISVVIAMYNSEDTIKRAINSVLRQSYDEVAIIIVDDGSTDRSVEVVRLLQVHEPKISLYSLVENKGAAYAKTFGVKQVKTEYFIFLDSDDEFSKTDAIQRIISCLDSKPDIVCGDKVKMIFSEEYYKIQSYYKPKSPYNYMMEFPFNYMGSPPFTFKASQFLDVGGFETDLKWGDGLVHIRRYLKKYPKVEYIESPIYNYYLNNTNNVSKVNKNYYNYLNFVDKCYLENQDYLEKNRVNFITWNLLLYFLYFKQGFKFEKKTVFNRLFITGLRHPVALVCSIMYLTKKVVNKFVDRRP
jgi:glycosyltransferase involved in cell wall biosynthesis